MNNPENFSQNIARAEDLPFDTSNPIQFVYRSESNLNLGVYEWRDQPSELTPDRPLGDNNLFYFKYMTITADVSELDYTSNILDISGRSIPRFNTYLKSDSRAVQFREPILVPKFLENWEFRLFWKTQQGTDKLLAGFTGDLFQGASLVGKSSVTFTAIITAYEIVDENYIKLFDKGYLK